MNYNLKLKSFLLLLLFLAFLLWIFNSNIGLPRPKEEASILNIKDGSQKNSDLFLSPFLNIELEAKAAHVFDLKNDTEIFSKNAEFQLPLASLAKLMTAVVAWENLDAKTVITISKNALAQEGDSGFFLDEKWLFSDLINIMLTSSSNDAAFAISETINLPDAANKTIELMNEKAAKLKLAQTFFLNGSGLDLNSDVSGAYGSAKDIAVLIQHILKNHPEILSKTNKELLNLVSLDGKPHIFENTNRSLNKISQLIAGKTGFTDLAGGNLAIVFDAGFNHPFLVIVLGSSFDGRFEDIEKLVMASYKYLELNF